MANTQSSYLDSLIQSNSNKLNFPGGVPPKDMKGYYDPKTNTFKTDPTFSTSLENKQKKSTVGGCGTSFTTATDPKDINVEQSLSGNIVKTETYNSDTQQTQYKIIKNDGSSFTMAEDGSIIFTTATKDGDPNTGRFDVSAQGKMRCKVGESLLIEISNKNNVTAGKDGDPNTAKALSIVVYGNVDITSHGGEINAKAKNMNFMADNEIMIKAGAKISLVSGEGTGQNKPKGNKQAAKEHGGIVEIKCGDYVMNSLTNRQVSSVNYNLVEADGATISTNKKSNYGFQVPGSFTIDIAGDYHEKIGGRKRTDIKGVIDPVMGLFPKQFDGWLINASSSAPTGAGDKSVVPNAVSIKADKGGFKFETKKGDIDIYTQSGFWGIGNANSVSVGLMQQYFNLEPGAYIYSKSSTKVFSKARVEVYVNTPAQSGITLLPAKVAIKNPSGIYLN